MDFDEIWYAATACRFVEAITKFISWTSAYMIL